MAAPVVLRNASDASVWQKYPNSNYSNVDRMGIINVAGGIQENFIYYALPFPRGVSVLSAHLQLTQVKAWSGSVTVNVQRIAASWSASTCTWNNKPASGAAIVTLTKSSPAANTVWDFDLTSVMQTVSNGGVWYGFRIWISSGGSTANWWYSPQYATIAYRPTFTVQWSDNPRKPSTLFPSGGRAVSVAKPVVRCDFFDVSGDTTMQSIQVQMNATDVWTAPTFDSGTVATSVPELDLSTTAYAGLAADATTYWRVRVQDGAGLWSPWSDSTSFIRKTDGTLTLNSPATTISDATPPVDWTFTGRTQSAYQVWILDEATRKQLWTSGKVTSTATVFTLPAKVLIYNNVSYRVILDVWDNIQREATPGDPIPVRQERVFTYSYSAATAPVATLTATLNTMFCYITLDFTRTQQPDKWNIYRNGKLIKVAETGAELFVSGSSYRWVDYMPPSWTTVVYTVIPVVNNVGSTSNPTATVSVKSLAPSLSDTDGYYPVLFQNPDVDMKLQSDASLFTPAGGGPPVIITQAERGYQGHLQAVLDTIGYGAGAHTAATQKANYLRLTDDAGVIRYLQVLDEAFECIVYNATIKPVHDGASVVYVVEFDFAQTDYIP